MVRQSETATIMQLLGGNRYLNLHELNAASPSARTFQLGAVWISRSLRLPGTGRESLSFLEAEAGVAVCNWTVVMEINGSGLPVQHRHYGVMERYRDGKICIKSLT